MKRRALVGGMSAVALLAGSAAALWQGRRWVRSGSLDIWSLRFRRPDGSELTLAQSRGQRVLLNFWATWCPPCLTEMPLLDRFAREYAARGWRVIGLAVDQPEPVQTFLKQRPVSFEIGLAGLEGIDLSRRLGNVNGALPFSVVFEIDGSVLHRKLGVVEPADLQAWSRSIG